MSQDVQSVATGVASLAADLRTIKLEQDASTTAAIFSWLTPLTTVFQTKHQESLTTNGRQDSGAQELLQRPEVKTWMSSTGTTLWCRGLPGVGKTITTSYTIESLKRQRTGGDVGLAFVYFSYKVNEAQTPVNIMASILQQLVTRKPNHLQDLKDLYSQHVRQNTRPTVADILNLLKNVLHSFTKVFLVVDALDECSDTDDVRSIFLTELNKLKHSICVLIMSRSIPDLDSLLSGAVRVDFAASPAEISNYLQQRLESTKSMQRHLADEPSLRDTIVARIMQKVKGMFLMARLYLDTLLNKTTRRKIKAALEALPGGLESIYEELMVRVKLQNPKDHAELAVKVLGWVFYAARPLTVTEVQHALAIEPGDTDLDEDGIPNRDLLVSVCCGMVMINDNSDTISLVHYTAQEYFQRSDIRLLDHANRDIAATCLTYLQFDSLDCNITEISVQETFLVLLRDHPLLGYAAQHWGNHLRLAGEKSTNEQAIELLEDDAKVHIMSWVRDYMESTAKGTYFRPRTRVLGLALASSFGLADVASTLVKIGFEIDEKDSEGQTALHRATGNGYSDTVTQLLDLGAMVDSRDATGWAALHQASAGSDEGTAKLLIDHGADVNARDGYSATPLYRAAEAGPDRIVKLLLLKRADVHVTNSYLQTALHRAADNGHVSVVEMLLKHGADPTAKDHHGYTPFYRAADQGHEDAARLLQPRYPTHGKG